METIRNKALVCPMNWGIGHASRCTIVIRILENQGFQVVIAATGKSKEFLERELPGRQILDFPASKIPFSGTLRYAPKMFRLNPILFITIISEHRMLKKIVDHIQPDLIISDNRLGCWNRRIPSVFMTHQLDLRLPGYSKITGSLVNALNRFFLRRYVECWIPDFEAHRGLAGDLSHPSALPPNVRYIGILSRFSELISPQTDLQPCRFDILVMLSGPDPQRSELEQKILCQLVNIQMQVAIVRGMPGSDEAYVLDNRIHVFSHLETEEMFQLIAQSSLVICRSGYSSIMDMVTIGKRAIFIPTPGQTEQEYLARYLMEKKIFFSIEEKQFDLLYALEMSKNFPGIIIRNDYKALIERIGALSESGSWPLLPQSKIDQD